MAQCTVYIKHDEQNRITAVNSSAFLFSVDGWVQIDEGRGDKYHHAQGNYFPDTLTDENGVYRYIYTPEGETLWRERTPEEMAADMPEPETPAPSDSERIETLEQQMSALMGGVADVQ